MRNNVARWHYSNGWQWSAGKRRLACVTRVTTVDAGEVWNVYVVGRKAYERTMVGTLAEAKKAAERGVLAYLRERARVTAGA